MDVMADVLLFIFSVILGLGWGSYATMATYRFPRNENWGGKKPRCPSCEHELKFRDFAPIWAYVVNRGRCKFCGVKVTPVYLCTEIYCLLVFILSYLAFGFSEQFLLVSLLGVFIVIFSVTELESKVIPDKALFLLLLFGSVYRAWLDQSIYGMIYGGLIAMLLGITSRHFLAWREQQSFDWRQAFLDIFSPDYVYVRIAILMGIILPIPVLIPVLCIAGAINALLYFISRRYTFSLPMPYGGVMGAGLMLAMLYC